jgi:hypothetical protein
MAEAGAALFPASTSEEMARTEPRPFLSSEYQTCLPRAPYFEKTIINSTEDQLLVVIK